MNTKKHLQIFLLSCLLTACQGGVEVVEDQDGFSEAFGQPERISMAAPEVGRALGLESAQPLGAFLNNAFPVTSPGTPSSSSLNDWVQLDYYPGLSFVEPIRVLEHPVENKLIVVGKDGLGWSVTHEPGSTDKTLFFNIQSIMHGKSGIGEGGISDLVFHPEFGQANSPNADYVYLSYRWSPTQSGTFSSSPSVDGYNRLSRFSVVNGQVDLNTEQVLINQFDRQQWHIGMDMFFGDDGFLYISVGDEGNCCNSEATNTQRLDGGLFSGVLRIDVDQDSSRSHPIRRQPANLAKNPQVNGSNWPLSSTQNYYIPNDNPFISATGAQLEEFYSIGLRHPWTISQDPVSQLIYTADVGQSAMEEINVVQKGDNHQWAYTEGTAAGLTQRPGNIIGNEAPPIFVYPRVDGQAVIGAGVYRGSKFPELVGKYLFSDFISGKFWASEPVGNDYETKQIGTVTAGFPNGINSYLMDSKGDILMAKTAGGLTDGGKIQYLARAADVVPSAEPPATLSGTGAFSDLATMTAAAGCIPYEMNMPFWSDNALKTRWMCIPNDGNHDTAEEQIGFSLNGDWTLPVGSVTIKHFELVTDDNNPLNTTRLETRFMVHGNDGWYGVTYRWDQSGTEAYLLTTGEEATFSMNAGNAQFDQTWLFPDRNTCMTCHNAVAGYVLGPKTRQLNKDMYYESTGVTANQIETLNNLGMLNPAIPDTEISTLLSTTLTSASIDDEQASLTDKARSYLDSNCGYCHRPSGVRAEFDARLTTPLAYQNLLFGQVNEPLDLALPSTIIPGDLTNSMIYHRANSAGVDYSMPPEGKTRIHTDGMELLAQWIMALDSFKVGNDTGTDGGFIDGHHPSLYINEQDTYKQGNESGPLYIKEFSFYARRYGNPVTPIVVRVDGDNDFTVLAIGTTRTSSDYFVGENTFDFLQNETVALELDAGTVIATGFMDSYPDGSGWGAGTVIPAEAVSGSTQDEVFGLLPSPLNLQSTAYNAGIDTATVSVNQKISDTNAGKSLQQYNLARSYKFAITFGLAESSIGTVSDNTVPRFVNGSFEEPVVNSWLTYDTGSTDITGWSITSGSVELDRTVWPGYDGLQSMDLNGSGPGQVQQTLTGFSPGNSYLFKFEYALHKFAVSSRSANVFINGQLAESIEADPGALVPNYQSAEIAFVAPANGVVTFGLEGTSNDSMGVIIDNLRIESAAPALPEIINPSFEQPVVATWALLDGGVGALPGWTINSPLVELDRTPWPAAEGDQSMDLNAQTASSLDQEISGFTAGANYTLTLDYALHTYATEQQSAQILINDQVVQTISAGTNAKAPNYSMASTPFVAPANGIVKIGLRGLGSSSAGIVVDNLRLTAQTTAEPVIIDTIDNNAADSLLVNGEFTNGLSSWSSCGGVQAVEANGLDSTNALSLSSVGCLYQEFPVTPGVQYRVDCVGRSIQDYSSVSLYIYDSAYTELNSQEVVLDNSTEYLSVGTTLDAAAGSAVGAITLYADSSAVFDGCRVVENTP